MTRIGGNGYWVTGANNDWGQAMGWERLRQSLDLFVPIANDLNLVIGENIHSQLRTVREFLDDQQKMEQADFLAKWTGPKFDDAYYSAIVADRLTTAAIALIDQPNLKKLLKPVLTGSLTQDFIPQQAKDYFYELEMAHTLLNAGFEVCLREPDLVVWGNGLSTDLGLACKYPSNELQIHEHFSRGYKQISRQGIPGFVVLGCDGLFCKELFKTPPQILNFQNFGPNPVTLLDQWLTEKCLRLVSDCGIYLQESPNDGAILTLNLWGVYASTAGIQNIKSLRIQCPDTNYLLPDIRTIVRALSPHL